MIAEVSVIAGDQDRLGCCRSFSGRVKASVCVGGREQMLNMLLNGDPYLKTTTT